MASSRASRSRFRSLVPWLVVVGILALVGLRITYLVTAGGYDIAFFVGAFFQSLQLGSLYALIALGYTMVYGIIRLINFAHGEIFMVGAFVAYFIFAMTPMAPFWAVFTAMVSSVGVAFVLNLWRGRWVDPVVLGGAALSFAVLTWQLGANTFRWEVALVLSMLITGVVGVSLDRVAYRPLRGAPRISLLITAIAMSFFLQNFGLLAFTANVTPFRPPTVVTNSLQIPIFDGIVYSSWLILVVPLLTAALVAALTLFVNQTRLGKAMRASAQDAETAQMMGVNVNRVIGTTFLLGSMLAAAGGVLWGLTYGSLTQPAVFGILPGIKAFAAAVIGGIGSLPGAVLGGVLLGFLENFLTALFPRTPDFAGITEFKDTFAFALLIVILLVKPSGIVGEDLSEKV